MATAVALFSGVIIHQYCQERIYWPANRLAQPQGRIWLLSPSRA